MIDNGDQQSMLNVCGLNRRYQTLVAEFLLSNQCEDIETIQTYLFFLLIAKKMLNDQQAVFDRYHLSEGKLSVLLLLKNAPQQQLTPSEIADAADVSRGTITGLLNGLEKDAFIIRDEDLKDKRKSTIRLSPHAAAVVEQLIMERSLHIEKLFACFSTAEKREQRALLEKLSQNLGHIEAV